MKDKENPNFHYSGIYDFVKTEVEIVNQNHTKKQIEAFKTRVEKGSTINLELKFLTQKIDLQNIIIPVFVLDMDGGRLYGSFFSLMVIDVEFSCHQIHSIYERN
jgi:hypothetical protein